MFSTFFYLKGLGSLIRLQFFRISLKRQSEREKSLRTRSLRLNKLVKTSTPNQSLKTIQKKYTVLFSNVDDS